MHHPPVRGALAVDHAEDVVVAVPVVDDQRLVEPLGDVDVAPERLVLRRAFAAAFADAIGFGIGTGEFPEQDAGLAAAALVGAVGEVLTDPLHIGAAAAGTVPDLTAFALRALGVPR